MTDRYKIANELSKGVLGTVHLADDTMLQRQVMLRHIEYGENVGEESRDDSWRKEFTQYAGKIGAMQHPNMLAIYDISVKDSGAHVVTQFVQGETLAERLERGALGQIGDVAALLRSRQYLGRLPRTEAEDRRARSGHRPGLCGSNGRSDYHQ